MAYDTVPDAPAFTAGALQARRDQLEADLHRARQSTARLEGAIAVLNDLLTTPPEEG